MDAFDGVALGEGVAEIAEAVGCRRDELLRDERGFQFIGAQFLAGFEAADAFAKSFLKGAPDGHDFTDGLHLGAEGGVGTWELFEGPLRDLANNIIDGGFEGRRSDAGDVVLQFVETVADGEFGSDLRDGEAGGF